MYQISQNRAWTFTYWSLIPRINWFYCETFQPNHHKEHDIT